MRVTNDHWKVLLDFAEINQEIITNRFVGMHGKSNCNRLWTELATQLNSLGYGEKSTEEEIKGH